MTVAAAHPPTAEDHIWWPERVLELPALAGLAVNPALPEELLLRLVDEHGELAAPGLRHRRVLPPPVAEAMRRHPSARVRAALAISPNVNPAIRVALVDDPHEHVRYAAIDSRDRAPLPKKGLQRLLDGLYRPGFWTTATCGEVLEELLRLLRESFAALTHLAAVHPDPRIRLVAARWMGPSAGYADLLLHDPDPQVRAKAAARHAESTRPRRPEDLPGHLGHAYQWVLVHPLSPALVAHVLASGEVEGIAAVATNASTPPETVATLVDHPAAAVRRRLATRPDLTGAQLACLAADPDVTVRTAVSVHPALTEAQRATIDIDVTTAFDDGYYGPCHDHAWRGPLPGVAVSVGWARSVNPLLRRRAARDPRLPSDLVARLANDPDEGVRVLLALDHPAAPPDLLLRTYLEYHRCGRDSLPGRPRFPTTGLTRYARDPDPAVRRIVALDRTADPTLIDQLAADPELTVRRRMANCPRLPVAGILELLDNPELAGAAAANTALPVSQVIRLIERG